MLGVAVWLGLSISTATGQPAAEPGVRATPLWFLAQLVPSPEVAYGEAAARFGLRWQVTPLLYSFGTNRRVRRWRTFVVEPLVRQSGSTEVFLGPEYLSGRPRFSDAWLWRAGLRSYFPLVERGDYLSVSLGTSVFDFAGQVGVAYEVGAYVLFGIVGAQLTWAPRAGPAETIATLRLRYF